MEPQKTGQFIRILRKQRGLTQRELAEAIGYSRSYVTAVLNGRRAPDCLALAEAQVRQWMDEAAARRR